MDEPADLTDARMWLQLAETKLEHARRIFETDLYDDAISRAYYAMFYAAKGALLTEGLDLRKHSSVVAKFREVFVVTGRVEATYLHYLGRVQSARERSDYAPFMPANREDANEVLTAASVFIAKMTEVVGASYRRQL